MTCHVVQVSYKVPCTPGDVVYFLTCFRYSRVLQFIDKSGIYLVSFVREIGLGMHIYVCVCMVVCKSSVFVCSPLRL